MMAAAIKWTNLDDCMPRGSKDYEFNQLLHERVVPCQDERLEKGSFLENPILLTMLRFLSFMHEMHEDMLCIHRILRIIHL